MDECREAFEECRNDFEKWLDEDKQVADVLSQIEEKFGEKNLEAILAAMLISWDAAWNRRAPSGEQSLLHAFVQGAKWWEYHKKRNLPCGRVTRSLHGKPQSVVLPLAFLASLSRNALSQHHRRRDDEQRDNLLSYLWDHKR